MKKIVLVLFLIILCGCSKNKFTEINYTKLYNKMSSYESYTVYFCNQTDKCQSFNNVLNKIIDETKIKIFYLDTSKLSFEEKNLVENIYFGGSNLTEPSIIIVKNGIVNDKQLYITDYDKTKEFLKKVEE